VSNPFIGGVYLARGLRIIARPGLRRFVVVPALLNTLLFGVAVWYAYQQYGDFLGWLQTWLPAWLDWLSLLLVPLFFVAALLVLFFGFSLVANLIASPFNGLLAERVEQHLTGAPLGGSGWGTLVRTLPATLWDEVKKLLYAVLWAIPFLVLFLIPVLNLAAPWLWLLFSAWIMALQYLDYPMGNHALKGAQMRRRLGSARLLALGFGGSAILLASIPVVNFIAMPASVAGATALWVERLRDSDLEVRRTSRSQS